MEGCQSWFIGLVLKTSEPERVPWVRIPLLPLHGYHSVTVNTSDCGSDNLSSILSDTPKKNKGMKKEFDKL